MKKTVGEYYQTNLISTTTGEFTDGLLAFHMQEIGAERIMFSVDYPFQNLEDGVEWFNNVKVTKQERDLMGRELTIKLLKLNDSDSH